MEQLHAYLDGRKKGDFAKSLGISAAYLSQLLSGHRTPSFALMRRIESETGGAVSFNLSTASERVSA